MGKTGKKLKKEMKNEVSKSKRKDGVAVRLPPKKTAGEASNPKDKRDEKHQRSRFSKSSISSSRSSSSSSSSTSSGPNSGTAIQKTKSKSKNNSYSAKTNVQKFGFRSRSSSESQASSQHSEGNKKVPGLRSAVERVFKPCRSTNPFRTNNPNPNGSGWNRRSPTRSRSPHRVSNPWRQRKRESRCRTVAPSKSHFKRRSLSRSPKRRRTANRSNNPWRSSRSPRRSRQSMPRLSSPHKKNPWKNRDSPRSPSPRRDRSPGKRKDLEQNKAEVYRRRHKITLASMDPRPIPQPVMSFRRTGFDRNIIQRLKQQGYDAPTPIQTQAWPVALAGRNFAMVSSGGTGRTLAYLLPALMHIQLRRRPLVVVLTHCRDVATRIHNEAQDYSRPRKLASQCILGQLSCKYDITSEGCQFLVTTPCRIKDILNGSGQALHLDRCSYLVLDGPDRMIDMDMEENMCQLLGTMRPHAQLVISAATWSRSLERMARKYMRDYVLIQMPSGGCGNQPGGIPDIRQRVEVMKSRNKKQHIQKELAAIYDTCENPGKVVIYADTSKRVDELVGYVRNHVPCGGIHSGHSAAKRADLVRDFRDGTYNIIVAENSISRELDISGIIYLFNYDLPPSMEEYVQRLTGTGWLSGSTDCEAISFFTHTNCKLAEAMIELLERSKQRVDPLLIKMAETGSDRVTNRNRYFNVNVKAIAIETAS
ncbi:putative ATP-dependent RNA helicase CG14443 [Drosophila rhopaloa]|uniref:RNA helicase n=1 Tax=Drosophila rhopaloa TaxID=1041015 RepID=A0A6P4E4D0_DRORH|nr:putative ATP-dependent RNA helicase CG14443 [Drosophila rhopaloa]